jgi:hypothetical protein
MSSKAESDRQEGEPRGRYMMATQAFAGENYRLELERPDICIIFEEDEENYIGNWVEGLGFVDLNFPKETTRDLTEEEKEKYHGQGYEIEGVVEMTLQTK